MRYMCDFLFSINGLIKADLHWNDFHACYNDFSKSSQKFTIKIPASRTDKQSFQSTATWSFLCNVLGMCLPNETKGSLKT